MRELPSPSTPPTCRTKKPTVLWPENAINEIRAPTMGTDRSARVSLRGTVLISVEAVTPPPCGTPSS